MNAHEKLEQTFLAYINAARNALTVANQLRDQGMNLEADDEVACARAMTNRARMIGESCEWIRTKYKLASPPRTQVESIRPTGQTLKLV